MDRELLDLMDKTGCTVFCGIENGSPASAVASTFSRDRLLVKQEEAGHAAEMLRAAGFQERL